MQMLRFRGVRRRAVVCCLAAASTSVTVAGLAAGGASAAGHSAKAASSSSPVLIGMSASLTGTNEVTGKISLQGNEYGVDAINKAGGVLGHKLKLIYLDDQSDPTQAQQDYQKLVTQDHVSFLIGPYSPALATEAGQIATRYKIPMLDPETAVPIIAGSKYAIEDEPGANQFMGGFADLVKKAGLKTIAIVGANQAFGEACYNGQIAQAKADHLNIVFQNLYDSTATDLTSVAQQIKSAAPDAVDSCSFYADGVAMTKGLSTVGYVPKMFGLSIAPSQTTFATSVGGLANRIVSNETWDPGLNTYGNSAFKAGFKKEFHIAPDYHAANGYATVQSLADAIVKAKSVNPGKVLNALYKYSFKTVLGTGKIVNSKAGPSVQGYPMYLYQIQNGKDVLIYPSANAKGVLQTPYTGS